MFQPPTSHGSCGKRHCLKVHLQKKQSEIHNQKSSNQVVVIIVHDLMDALLYPVFLFWGMPLLLSHMLHVWNIYQHVPQKTPKCRKISHTLSIWVCWAQKP